MPSIQQSADAVAEALNKQLNIASLLPPAEPTTAMILNNTIYLAGTTQSPVSSRPAGSGATVAVTTGIGEKAVTRLLKMMEHEDKEFADIEMPVELVVRESTRA